MNLKEAAGTEEVKSLGHGTLLGFRAGDWKRPALAATPYVVLVGMCVLFAVLTPTFLSVINAQNIARQSSVLLVVGVAEAFVILMGCIDLSVGSIVTLTGIVAAFETQNGTSESVVVIQVIALGAAAGLTNGLIYSYGRLPSFLVTLGTSYVFNGIALRVIGGVPVVLNAPHLSEIVGGKLFALVPTIAVVSLAVLIVAVVIARWTTFGRGIYAIGGAERVARLSGIPVQRTKVLTFVLAGTLCGIGGLLLAVRIDSGSPDMGSDLLLNSIAAVVIGGTPLTGGIGGPQRTLLGVLVLGVLLDGMTLLSVDPFTQLIVEGIVVIAAVAVAIERRRVEIIK